MISLEDFRAEFINDINASAASDPQHPYPLDVFIEESIEVLRVAFSLINEMEPHSFIVKGSSIATDRCFIDYPLIAKIPGIAQ